MTYSEYMNVLRFPKGYWDNIENVRKFLSYVAQEENYTTIEDWYKFTHKKLISYGFHTLHLHKYGGNLSSLFNKVYNNQYEFVPWKFGVAHNGFWDSIENQRLYMNWLFKELKYETMEDWYNISMTEFYQNYGASLFNKHSSIYDLIKAIFPDYEFLPWKFKHAYHGFWLSIENQKMYMDWLFKTMSYETMEDWYKIKREDFNNNYGGSLLLKYESYCEVIVNLYPDYKFLPWKFNNVYHGFWDSIKNQRDYTDWLFKKMGYETMEDWCKIKRNDFNENYGGSLLNRYNSYSEAIKILYPEYELIQNKFKKFTPSSWESIENQRIYTDLLFNEMGYETMEDWYKIKREDFHQNNGGSLITRYRSSFHLLKTLYPEYELLPWKFERIYTNFWEEKENHKWYMDWLFKEKGFKKLEDWYKICLEDFEKNYGATILFKYDSIYQLIKTLYPDYEFVPWKFTQVCPGFWEKKENHKWYTDWLFKEMKFQKLEDWYKINRYDFRNNYGRTLLKYYKTYYELIKTLYPDYDFVPWKFTQVCPGFWDSIENQKWYMNWLFQEMKYETMDDWYKITYWNFISNYGATLLNKYNRYSDIFLTLYPDYEWYVSKFSYLKGESILCDFLSKNFDNVIQGFRVDWCKNYETDCYLPFDFCVPDIKSIIELDGGHHFIQVSDWNTPVFKYRLIGLTLNL